MFTDLQRRTLQAIFRDTKRPTKEMQITISQQLGLDLSTVGNFFMNARRRSQDKWLEDTQNVNSNSNTCSSIGNDFTNNGLNSNQNHHLMSPNFTSNCNLNTLQQSNAMSSIVLNNTSNSVLTSVSTTMLPSTQTNLSGCGLNSKLITNSSNSNCSSQSSLASPSSTTSPHLICKQNDFLSKKL